MTSELYVLRIVEPAPGGAHAVITGDGEWIVPPLKDACTVRVEDEEFHLSGRKSVFASVTDFAYAPRDARAQIASGAGGRFALAGAKCERQLPARYGPAPEVPHARRTRPRCVLSCTVPDPLTARSPRQGSSEERLSTHGGERSLRPSRIRDHSREGYR
jgi:5-deoxy-D-glucuronate isomerase